MPVPDFESRDLGHKARGPPVGHRGPPPSASVSVDDGWASPMRRRVGHLGNAGGVRGHRERGQIASPGFATARQTRRANLLASTWRGWPSVRRLLGSPRLAFRESPRVSPSPSVRACPPGPGGHDQRRGGVSRVALGVRSAIMIALWIRGPIGVFGTRGPRWHERHAIHAVTNKRSLS